MYNQIHATVDLTMQDESVHVILYQVRRRQLKVEGFDRAGTKPKCWDVLSLVRRTMVGDPLPQLALMLLQALSPFAGSTSVDPTEGFPGNLLANLD